MVDKERKKRECDDNNCEIKFFQYKSTDKYCSYKCAAKNTNPLQRTPLNPVALTPKRWIVKKYKKFKKAVIKSELKQVKKKVESDFEREFSKAKIQVKKRVEKEHGRLCCEKCKTGRSIQFSTHHLIYRSERPKHPMLNNTMNLLYLCFDCHEWFHKRKKNRNKWILENKLWELFDRIWGYEED
tara:strand:+ start:1235 stop:1786 length:552 start_codon:yes stop_codon:yes gene_type:complete